MKFFSRILSEQFTINSSRELVAFDSGTTYTFKEVEAIKDVSPETRRNIHEVKRVFNDSTIEYCKLLEAFERKQEEKTFGEVDQDASKAEAWLVANPNHKRFEDVFAKFCITLRVYGKKHKTSQPSLFDVCKSIKKD